MSVAPDTISFVCDGCKKLVTRTRPADHLESVEARYLCIPCCIKEAGLIQHPEIEQEGRD